ncbi:MAG: hypothetical protein JXR52_11895 [Bacteroidales bacterium]|nr:hypothetical protein [Bacteroidales bacterium]MBN2699518.1 hypothetical protein [Bacteroidales bacterium]
MPPFTESIRRITASPVRKMTRTGRIGIFSILLLPLLTSYGCDFEFKREKNSEKPIARVNDRYLYPSDLRSVTDGLDERDSILTSKRYIDTWVREELMLHRAEMALSEDQKNFEHQIEEYRKSLLIYSYRQKLLQQKLDTTITPEEVYEYYENNMDNFILSEDIIKGTFVKVPLTAPTLYKVRAWSRNNTPDDLNELEKYCADYAEIYNDFNDSWIAFTSIKDQIPLAIRQPSAYLRYNRNIETRDSIFIYFLHITNHKTTGDVSPPEMVFGDIKSILLNKRKIEFFQDLETRVFNDGVSKNLFEIY